MLQILHEKLPTHQVIAVAAGKGGVGKSLLAVHLALAFIKKGYKVGILDADIYGPSLQQMLPMDVLPRLNEVDPTWIIPGEKKGLRIVTMAIFGGKATIVRAPIANSLIDQFLNKVQWGTLDFLLVDFPPGTGDIQLTLMQKGVFTGGILITTPQEVAVIDVRKAGQMFQKMSIPILGVVENMSYFEESNGQKQYPFGQGGGRRLAMEFSVPFLGEIPLDPKLAIASDQGESIFEIASDSPSACALEEIANRVQKELIRQIKKDLKLSLLANGNICFEGHVFLPSELQIRCPCARCAGQGKSELNVKIVALQKVGRYALKIQFTSGCSQGIYSVELLQLMTRK